MLCSFSYAFFFIGDKITADRFKDEITPSLRANYRLKFAQDVALNHAVGKRKPQYKIFYNILKKGDGYDPLLDISPYPTFIQLKYFLGGIHHCVAVVGKCIFDNNFHFALPLTKENLDDCLINDNEKKGMNGYKGVLKEIGFFTKENDKSVIQK